MTEQTPRVLVNWTLESQGTKFKGQLDQLGAKRSLTIQRHSKEGKVDGVVRMVGKDRDFSPLLESVSRFVKEIGL